MSFYIVTNSLAQFRSCGRQTVHDPDFSPPEEPGRAKEGKGRDVGDTPGTLTRPCKNAETGVSARSNSRIPKPTMLRKRPTAVGLEIAQTAHFCSSDQFRREQSVRL